MVNNHIHSFFTYSLFSNDLFQGSVINLSYLALGAKSDILKRSLVTFHWGDLSRSSSKIIVEFHKKSIPIGLVCPNKSSEATFIQINEVFIGPSY